MENTLKTVVSFEYADAGKKSVFIVKANSVEPNCCEVLSEMTPGLMLGGGIVTELDENGQEVSEHSTSQIAIPPCFDSYPGRAGFCCARYGFSRGDCRPCIWQNWPCQGPRGM